MCAQSAGLHYVCMYAYRETVSLCCAVNYCIEKSVFSFSLLSLAPSRPAHFANNTKITERNQLLK